MLYVPRPYPDEIFASILIRAARHAGRSFASILSILGKEAGRPKKRDHSAALLDLASKLGVPAGGILESHTTFPYVTCFLPAELRARYASWALNAPHLHYTQLSHYAKFAPTPWAKRFCVQCVSEDSKALGEAYWHRQHCIPGLAHCPIHRTPLFECDGDLCATLALPSDFNAMKEPHPPPSPFADIVMQLSLHALNGKLMQLDYRSALKELGYAVPLSLVAGNDFSQAVLEAAGAALLQDIGCGPSDRCSSSWPAHVVMGRPNAFPTPRHIIVQAHLCALVSNPSISLL